jgi:opacity protein-like surface antigen
MMQMKKQITLVSILLLLISGIAEAQIYGGGIYMQRGYRRPPPPRQQHYPRRQKLPAFKPTVNLSIGYGFPNLDKNYLSEFYNAYQGTATQTGPVTAALDYQFSRYNSIGVMGTYGKVSVPYIDYNSNNGVPDFTGKLENWSVMFNMMSYFPSYATVSPYIRTAIGINNWKQDYLNPDGSKAAVSENPTSLAYQVSIGTRFNLSPNAGFYIEAGYGKYIVNGGLTFRF